ncbi:MAG: ABC transporter permease [Verrucomicrobiales bacterium]|nr:ABC transporter permease [Verrucomicrobiales bacterium]
MTPSPASNVATADPTGPVPSTPGAARARWRPAAEAVAIPVGAVLAALGLFGLFCLARGVSPLEVYAAIYKAAFGSGYSFQNTLVRASPLMLTALCTALPARLGLVVIGNEGALVVGGLVAAASGLAVAAMPFPVVLSVMTLTGAVAGGLWIALTGFLHTRRGVNETIASLLLNYIAIALLNHLVNGPLRDPESLNKPSTRAIPDDRMIPMIGETTVHWGLAFGVVACVAAWFLMEHSPFGFAVRTCGGNLRAGRLAGLPVARLTWVTCFLAGAAAGLAGMIEVAAVHGRANESLAAGYGYAGILVAFVARHRGIPILLVATLLGGILASGGILQRQFKLPDATILVFQGFVFVMILLSDAFYGRFAMFRDTEARR